MLDDLNDADLFAFREIMRTAKWSAEQLFSKNLQTDGEGDAYRHMLWNAMLSRHFGADWTEKFTTAHEGHPPASSNSPAAESMDLYNNELGRSIALENPDASQAELMEFVFEAVASGRAAVVRDGKLAYSTLGRRIASVDWGWMAQSGMGGGNAYAGGYGYR